MPFDRDTMIEHVRLRNAQVDVPVARLRLSYLLSSMDLRPAAMPPSAVLVVRSMRDPLPQRITSEFVSAATPSRAWEGAAQSQMAAFYRSAARPVAGSVPTSAESVLFSDHAELLACLALDMGAANSWWGKSILRRFSSRGLTDWKDVWLQHPRYIPAAMHHLDRQGRAVERIERLSSLQAWELLAALARAFALSEALVSEIESCRQLGHSRPGQSPSMRKRQASPPQDAPSGTDEPSPGSKRDFGFDNTSSTVPPWEPSIPSSSAVASRGTAQQALLGVSLLLNRAPEEAASASFSLRFRAWLADAQPSENEDRQVRAAASIHGRTASPGVHTRSEGNDSAPSPSTQDLDHVDTRARKSEKTTGFDPNDTTTARAPGTNAPATVSSALETNQPTSVGKLLESLLELENGVLTALGGIFYLIHLVLQAELLSFDTGLGGWALLDLLARCLLGRSFASHADDPVWAALAALDGREIGTVPGASFKPHEIYEAPASWMLESEPSTPRYVRLRHRRVEIWHAEGFPVFDSEGPAPPLPTGLLPFTRDRRKKFRSAGRIDCSGMALSPQLQRFLHFILPYARWRLREALGETSPLELMARAGTLYISGTHLDLVMGMNQISLPARLAGLDANPGWIPQLGRVLAFHFIEGGPRNG